ncbi:hypothetical protein GOHSU_26_00040 [Gordonia hirsuta DSM 44140 = NBRC 16056]|uniref:DUF1697 domain-containing protein n=1 Tax=Gordonia hirsuta DSM 44140 = NBRC 16056 TaxID=1121927 RepID=L7LCP0_9ACTN|nr:hypothetical protein GOHSU_26_00040 [Gordonia hirsuta DSM 44140 = NBRC 16056]
MNDEPRIHMLRAVNVGGARLPMARLREIAADLGATRVRTYIASGNLLCRPPGPGFDRALEEAIGAEFGFSREVISRTADELAQALSAYPFGTPPDFTDTPHGHICFLTAAPDPDNIAAFTGRDFGAGERLAVIGRQLHLDYPSGVGTSKLTAPVIATGLGVPGTARNLRTVTTLIALARD